MKIKKNLKVFSFSVFMLCVFVFSVEGQVRHRSSSIIHDSRVDKTIIHYGYSIGFGVFDYRIINSGFLDAEGFAAEPVKFSPAFRLGVIGEWNITNHVSLRSIPGLYFGKRTITFNKNTLMDKNVKDVISDDKFFKTVDAEIKSIYADIPILFKYRGVRINNYNYYFVMGVSYHADLMPHNKLKPHKNVLIRTKWNDFAIDFGGGVDFYFRYFKVGMELRISIGLLDIMNHQVIEDMPKYKAYTKAIGSMKSTLVTLSFNFE